MAYPAAQFIKDPDAVLDYQVDWTTWLNSDTIAGSEWDVPDGITLDSDSNTDTAATIWLSGGTVGSRYLLVNRITTAAGRIDDRTIKIIVKER